VARLFAHATNCNRERAALQLPLDGWIDRFIK